MIFWKISKDAWLNINPSCSPLKIRGENKVERNGGNRFTKIL